MKGLLAILYFAAIGWAVAHYELDRLMLEAGHKMLTGLMRESAQISLAVVREEQAAALASAPPPHWVYVSASDLVTLPVIVPRVLPGE